MATSATTISTAGAKRKAAGSSALIEYNRRVAPSAMRTPRVHGLELLLHGWRIGGRRAARSCRSPPLHHPACAQSVSTRSTP